jgi:apolipoprotein N-acyltransferase
MRGWILGLGFGPSLLLASSASVLIALGAPPGGWLPGQWLGFVPLIVLARRAGVTPRQAAGLGLVGGLGIGLLGFPWLVELLVRFGGLPGPVAMAGLLLFSLWMAIPYSLWALGLRLGPFTGWRSYAWPVVLFVALQFGWPNLFPYTPLIGFAERPAFMQLAEIGGVPLLEALVVGWAVAAARALTREGLRTAAGDLAVILLLPPLLLAYGNARMVAVDAQAAGAPKLRVGIVQPNIPVGGMSMEARLERLRGPSAELARAGAQLVVWPEAGAFPYRVSRPLAHDRDLGSARVMVGHRVPTLLGAGSRAPGARYGYNSVYLLAGDGAVLGRYDKVNLVPLGESVPVVDPDWLTDRIPNMVHLEAGEGPVRFPVPPGEGDAEGRPAFLGPVICFEDIIPGFVRRVAGLEGGVEFFVNVTIDAWYGDTAEPWEHLALAQFRSVEHRVPLVRSTSTGVSAVVDAAGRVQAYLPLRPVEAATAHLYPPETLIVDLVLARNTRAQPTPYARGGWLLPHACVAIVLASGAFALLGRGRTRAA